MYWEVSKLLSEIAMVKTLMGTSAEDVEEGIILSHPANACAKLSDRKSKLEVYLEHPTCGFADPVIGKYIIPLVLDDIQNTIYTTLERICSDIQLKIDPKVVEASMLHVTLRSKLQQCIFSTVCKEHAMCGDFLLDRVVVTPAGRSDTNCTAAFYSGDTQLFSMKFWYIDDLWVTLDDISFLYLRSLDALGCKVGSN